MSQKMEYELAFDVVMSGVVRVKIVADSIYEARRAAESKINQMQTINVDHEVEPGFRLTEVSIDEDSADVFEMSSIEKRVPVGV